jgi:tetratricopeptide (TPR) repeat protein
MTRPVLALLFFSLTSLPAPAADKWPVPRGASHEPVPYVYDPKVVARLPHEFLDDAAACIIYSGTTHLIEADGTVETISHEVYRLNGRKGIEKLGEHRNASYDPSYEKLTLHLARVHKPDGRVVDVQPRHVQLRDVSTDFHVYDTDKQLVISFPSLEVGDVFEVKWTVRSKNPEYDGQFFNRYSFGDATYPVALDEIRVRVAKGKTLKYTAVNKPRVEPTITTDEAGQTFHWQAVNCPRPAQDENLPSKEELYPSIVFSTFGTWEEVGRWKQRVRAQSWKCTPEISTVVAEVTRGLDDPTAKARALTYWLRRNIRYVSAGEQHGFTPHPPAMVLANRFGDCKDTSQLLAVMLREAGLKVDLVTLGTVDAGQIEESVPSPGANHAILVVTIGKDKHWIDTTSSLAGWDQLPRDDCDRVCYLVDDQGRLRLDRTPRMTAEGNRTVQETHVWVGTDGTTQNQRTVTTFGLAALAQRDNFLEVPAGERRRLVASELQDSNSRNRLTALSVDEAALRDLDQPVTVRSTYETPLHFTGTPDREGSFTDSKVWGKLLAYNLDYDRDTPFELYAPFESRHRYVVHLPAGLTLDAWPRPKKVTSKWGSFTLTIEPRDPSGRVLDFTFHTRMDKVRVEPADFEDYRKFHEEVNRSYRAWVTLTPVSNLSQAPVLEALLLLDPGDSATAATLARLYQSNQRETDARRVLAAARQHTPDDSVLWEMSLKSALPADEETFHRELVRRFPDEAKYALELASFLIQRGDQAGARALLEPLTLVGAAADRALAHFHLARSHYRKDELGEALNHLDAAVLANPETVNTVRAHILRGQILEESKRPREAVRAYEWALERDKEATFALEALARLALADGRREEALELARRLATVAGEDVSALLAAADYLLRLDRADEAFDLAMKVREQGFNARAQRILGLVWLRRGEPYKALPHLDKAEADARVAEGLLTCYLALGDLEGAEKRLPLAERFNTPPVPTLEASCERVRTLARTRDALVALTTAPPGKADSVRQALGQIVCAEAAYRDGQSRVQVESLLRQTLTDCPDLAAGLALRARLALDRGQLRAALPDAERAITLGPRLAAGYFVRGRVQLERDRDALPDLLEAAQLSGRQDAEVLQALAAAQQRAGKLADAVATQREAVKLRPQDKELLQQLEDLEKMEKKVGAN